MPLLRTLLLTLPLVMAAALPARAIDLVMVEEAGCIWCQRWHADIGPIYPKTEAGRTAPLRQVDLRRDLPGEFELKAPVIYTPTFILVDGNRELARVEGYPGEDFFWALIEKMIADHTTNEGGEG